MLQTTYPALNVLIRGVVFLAAAYGLGLSLLLILRVMAGDRWWWLALLNLFAFYLFLPLIILLPLALILRAGWIAALLGILLGIGLIAYGPRFLPKARAAGDGLPLRIVTFNMYPYNQRLDEVVNWLAESGADIVFLQDIPPQYVDGIPALRERLPHQVAQAGTFEVAGSMLLSRYPIAAQADFRLQPGTDLAQQRIELDVDGTRIAVYNLHLAYPFRQESRLRLPGVLNKLDFAFRYDDTLRRGELLNLMTRLRDERLPFIACGDFNMGDGAAIHDTLATIMGDSFLEAGTGLGLSWPAGESEDLPDLFPPLLRLDYIWHSGAFRALDAARGPSLGSDHLPFTASLELLPGS